MQNSLFLRSRLLLLFIGLSLLACKPSVIVLNNAENKPITASTQSEIAAIISPYKLKIDSVMNKTIGNNASLLTKAKGSRNLGNFAADAILYAANKQNARAQIAFITSGGLRAEVPQGPITIGTIYELMPFDNEIVVIELLGFDIKQLLKLSIKGKNQAYSKGFEAKFNTDSKLEYVKLNGIEILDNVQYRVAMSDYLANGGDNLEMLTAIKNKFSCNLKVRDGIIMYIEEKTANKEAIASDNTERILYP